MPFSSALLTDLYELTMLQAYRAEHMTGRATFSLFVRDLPPQRNFLVAAGLSGKAKVNLASGGPLGGRFTVNVAPAPATTHVDPATGRVVAGAAPAVP